jgi:hypothetical protein
VPRAQRNPIEDVEPLHGRRWSIEKDRVCTYGHDDPPWTPGYTGTEQRDGELQFICRSVHTVGDGGARDEGAGGVIQSRARPGACLRVPTKAHGLPIVISLHGPTNERRWTYLFALP